MIGRRRRTEEELNGENCEEWRAEGCERSGKYERVRELRRVANSMRSEDGTFWLGERRRRGWISKARETVLIRFRWVWSALKRERPLKITSESSIRFRFESEMAKISHWLSLIPLFIVMIQRARNWVYTLPTNLRPEEWKKEKIWQAGFSFDYASSPRFSYAPYVCMIWKWVNLWGSLPGALLDYAIICKLWAAGGQQRIEKGTRIGSSFHWKRLSNTVVVLNCLNKEGAKFPHSFLLDFSPPLTMPITPYGRCAASSHSFRKEKKEEQNCTWEMMGWMSVWMGMTKSDE